MGNDWLPPPTLDLAIWLNIRSKSEKWQETQPELMPVKRLPRAGPLGWPPAGLGVTTPEKQFKQKVEEK